MGIQACSLPIVFVSCGPGDGGDGDGGGDDMEMGPCPSSQDRNMPSILLFCCICITKLHCIREVGGWWVPPTEHSLTRNTPFPHLTIG